MFLASKLCSWKDDDEVLLLIKTFHGFTKSRKKIILGMAFWKKVQSEMFAKSGCTKTAKQCESKWKQLTRSYKQNLF